MVRHIRQVLAVDPGNVESAWALIDLGTRRPTSVGKADNDAVRSLVRHWSIDCTVQVAVEMVANMGMSVGKEVFDTVLQIGRLVEIHEWETRTFDHISPLQLRIRRDVKLHHCDSVRANDGNIIQALIDRFAYGVPNRGKGTKKAPGWFYGFAADIWQAYALAVLVADEIVAAQLPG